MCESTVVNPTLHTTIITISGSSRLSAKQIIGEYEYVDMVTVLLQKTPSVYG